jgi:RNA-directed DNA polymerase
MSQLDALKAATSLRQIARLLETTASGLAYVLYKTPEAEKYKEFEVPKRSGGTRKISAPVDGLRLLQARLSILLQNCLQEIEDSGGRKNDVAHGFKRGRSIMTNGECHRKMRYVFNIDLKDFFPSINFGRVRGFFINDRNFALHPKVATFLAQIACYRGALPQGSPCSPVISNLIGHILDTHIVRLAADEGCRYTRYADDLTFSTNKPAFPESIATQVDATNEWVPGLGLVNLVTKSGFAINPLKTRMQYRDGRQDVTGLVVNRKVNVRSDYRRDVRQMTHHLVTRGEFEFVRKFVADDGTTTLLRTKGTPSKLHGMLAFVDQVDLYNLRQIEKGFGELGNREVHFKLSAKESTYRRFLLFNQFYMTPKPVVLCEGSTDNVYLVHAIRSLVADFPTLATKLPNGEININVRFYRYFKRRKKKLPAGEHSKDISSTGRILELKGGSGELLNFAKLYRKHVEKFTAPGALQPVILLVDNDGGANSIYGYIKGTTKVAEPKNERFIHLFRNLYVVPTPLTPEKPIATMIEDFFDDDLKKTLVEGKSFDPRKQDKDHTSYGKVIFAHRVVRPKADAIDFSGFKQLLSNLSLVIETHRTTHPAAGQAI